MPVKSISRTSLCGLFLLQAAKQADRAFQVTPTSTHHTVRDASRDVLSMVTDLLDTGAVEEREKERTAPQFQDPSTKGMEEKAAKGWIESLLTRGCDDDDDSEDVLQEEGEVTVDYELFHVL